MSSGQSMADVQSYTALDLDAEAQLMQADDVDLHGFPLDATPNDSLQDDAPPQGAMDASHFGDFQFPFQPMDDDSSIVAMAEDSPNIDIFPRSQQHRPSISSIPTDRRGSITSATGQLQNFTGIAASHRRLSQATSEDGSPDSNGNGLLLEDPAADEFGLIPSGPGDASGAGKFKDEKGDLMPAWSELKTKAGKERKRLPLACIACRRKKIRCSGEKPACKHCLRSRIPCVYKVTARKAAPRTDYMAMLDKRLKRMEERIIKTVPKAEYECIAATVVRSVLKPAIPGTVNVVKGAAKKRGADEAFGSELENWARSTTKSKTDASVRLPATLLLHEAEENKLLQEGADALPPRDIQEHLAEVFFDDIYGQAYHLLHRPSYMRKLRAGTLPPVLILSVCAVSARFSTHPKLNTNPNFLRGEEWASHARDIVTRRYEWPNITILTCLLVLGLHEFGTCHGGRSWALGGQAIRMAFALQLHKDLEYDPHSGRAQLSFIDREIRRRTMWACFLMDRFNSSGTERPTFIKEETVKIPLPVKEKYFQLDIPGATEDLHGLTLSSMDMDEDHASQSRENMGVAAYMIRSIAIWGRIINHLNQGGKELDPHPMWSPDAEYAKLIKQSEDLPASLPESLQYSRENLKLHDTEGMANQFLFLHISIQQNILFMNRFAVSSSPGTMNQHDVPKSFITKAGAKAFSAANRMSELLKDAEPYLVSAPFVGYCTFLSSTVHIFGIFSGNPAIESTSKRNLATNVRFLSKMKRFWGMFHFMTENLREQYRACADAARQGNPASENNSPQIFQYGDWFDRYPHGVSHSDFLDPVKYRAKEKGNDAVLEQKPELATVEEFMTKMSPRSAEGAPNNTQGGKPQPAKKKPIAKRAGSVASRHQLDPIVTDVAGPGPSEQPAQQQSSQQGNSRRSFSGSMAGQANGPSYTPLTMAQSANPTSYHALSPISPVAMSAFPHHQRPHPNSQFYSPEQLSLSLSQQTTMGILPQLDRQLVFGAYGSLHPGMSSQMLDGGIWDGMGGHRHGDGGRRAHGSTDALHAAMAGGHGLHNHQNNHHNQHHHHHNSHESASSAWFMPFNMEPPEIGHDLTSLDGLGAIFGGSMTTPGGMGGGSSNPNHNGH